MRRVRVTAWEAVWGRWEESRVLEAVWGRWEGCRVLGGSVGQVGGVQSVGRREWLTRRAIEPAHVEATGSAGRGLCP